MTPGLEWRPPDSVQQIAGAMFWNTDLQIRMPDLAGMGILHTKFVIGGYSKGYLKQTREAENWWNDILEEIINVDGLGVTRLDFIFNTVKN